MAPVVLGRSHAVVKRVRRLRRDRAYRDAEGVFLAEGIHLAQEALQMRAQVELALISPALPRVRGGAALPQRFRESGWEVHETPPAVLDSLQDARSPQPVLLVVRHPGSTLDEVLAVGSAAPLVVLAHELQDPGNLGNILRTADAAGATGLVAMGAGVDLFHPRAVRATMGSIFRLCATSAPAGPVLDAVRARGLTLLAADPSGRVDYLDAALTGPVALLLGGEGRGLPPRVAARADARLRIPMAAGVNSLSVGASAAVILYEAARQRRGATADRDG